MGRQAGQDPALKGLALVVAAQILGIKDRAIRVVITNSLVRVTSSISQDTRVIQSSFTVASITFLPQVFVREIRRFISVRSVQLSRQYLNTCDGLSSQLHGVERITCPGLRIGVN